LGIRSLEARLKIAMIMSSRVRSRWAEFAVIFSALPFGLPRSAFPGEIRPSACSVYVRIHLMDSGERYILFAGYDIVTRPGALRCTVHIWDSSGVHRLPLPERDGRIKLLLAALDMGGGFAGERTGRHCSVIACWLRAMVCGLG
jgi:hypothetical protein